MDSFRFYHPIEIRYADLDPQGHVNNAHYLTLFEQTRLKYLEHLGLFTPGQSFLELGIIIAEIRVAFLTPVTLEQQVRIGMRTAHLGNKSLETEYSLQDAVSGDELAACTTILVAFDYQSGQTVQIPDRWRKIIEHFENGD
ncbi:MAG: acyl-CoA thioesterase [Anaerolineales bacterium]|nr:acyl-CoA thioesterase [Anaerolineales bacterium]